MMCLRRALRRSGLRGIAFTFINYLAELPYVCDEVLPRLERMGHRGRAKPASSSSSSSCSGLRRRTQAIISGRAMMRSVQRCTRVERTS